MPTGRDSPGSCADGVSRSSRSTGRTARPAAARESPIPSTPSRRPGPLCRVGPRARPSPATVPWRPSGSWWSPSARPDKPEVQALTQMRHLGITAPDELRCRMKGLSVPALVAEGGEAPAAKSTDPVTAATKASLSSLAHRVQALDHEIAELDEMIDHLVATTAPDLLALFGVGPDTAAALLVTAGDNPERLRSEAAWAHLCGVSPSAGLFGQGDPSPARPGR